MILLCIKFHVSAENGTIRINSGMTGNAPMRTSTHLGIDLGHESAPDATTLLKFRHLLEANELTRRIFDAINDIWPKKV